MNLNKINNSNLTKRFKNTFFYVILSSFILVLCINFVMLFKYIYYIDIKYLKLEEISELSFDNLKSNYNYLIDFLYSNSKNFSMPYFKSSYNGRVHFFEVRNIIKTLNCSLLVTAPISIFYVLRQNAKKNFHYLKYVSIILCSFPFLLLLPLAINFSKAFDTFHHILFNNDYWIFDETLDPVITVLPERFFMHEGFFLLLIILIISISLYFIYRKKKRSS
ncbi:TIGR01906 family membrane protein [Hathewaya histolytica]|uniref:Membrane spanning protein n=1 Tax=Hathewaya histolytica TaxID=1498 RepID=A0A4U9RQQ8_HATHI|nr:TIGR01906 family membrane protein [Hathewaya histolytica]VTQ93881.1 membrane spanning protein [Hathewaya histolytica]